MLKIKKYITRNSLEKLSIFLSSTCVYSASEIKDAILQLDSVDDALVVIHESVEQNISLNHCVYLRLKGRFEEERY